MTQHTSTAGEHSPSELVIGCLVFLVPIAILVSLWIYPFAYLGFWLKLAISLASLPVSLVQLGVLAGGLEKDESPAAPVIAVNQFLHRMIVVQLTKEPLSDVEGVCVIRDVVRSSLGQSAFDTPMKKRILDVLSRAFNTDGTVFTKPCTTSFENNSTDSDADIADEIIPYRSEIQDRYADADFEQWWFSATVAEKQYVFYFVYAP